MPLQITVKELRKGPYLNLFFSIICNDGEDPATIREFKISNLAMVRFQFRKRVSRWQGSVECGFSVKKHELAKKHPVKINITFLTYSRELVCTEDWTDWIQMGIRESSTDIKAVSLITLEITMTVSKVNLITFPQLYEEVEFCDFHLRMADGSGSVPVHKVCLITHSDMFKRMLLSKWKETEENCIAIKDVTPQTLQNFKDYIYLGVLPDDGLRPLLLLAKCYLMENLKEECVAKLAQTVKPEDLHSLQEFAVNNKLPELICAIVQLTPDTTVQGAYEIKCAELQKDT